MEGVFGNYVMRRYDFEGGRLQKKRGGKEEKKVIWERVERKRRKKGAKGLSINDVVSKEEGGGKCGKT